MEAVSSFGHMLLGMAGTGAVLYTSGWHQSLLSWYQRLLLVRDHPLGRHRLRGRRWAARTIWLSRRELLRRYAGPWP
jgi:hypothetical protein